MNSDSELDRDRSGKTQAPIASAKPQSTSRQRRGQPGEVGDALRTVYQRTIDEAIPPEMLDLLGKLG